MNFKEFMVKTVIRIIEMPAGAGKKVDVRRTHPVIRIIEMPAGAGPKPTKRKCVNCYKDNRNACWCRRRRISQN